MPPISARLRRPCNISRRASVEQSAWYLRGDIGVGMDSSNLMFEQNPLNSSNFAFDHASMADTHVHRRRHRL